MTMFFVAGSSAMTSSSQTMSAIHQLFGATSDHSVIEKDTYLIYNNNQFILIPAGAVSFGT